MSRSDELTVEDHRVLLRLARAAIRDAVSRESELPALLEENAISPAMRVTRGVFVTLKRESATRPGRDELRGCVGNVASALPLYRNIVRTAPRAALEDPRFPKLPPEEVAEVRIEISALTELAKLEKVEDLVIGTDGVQLERDGKLAVFLPQVAREQGWDTGRFMEQLAVKAGLPRNGWKGAELSVFQVEHFAER